MSNSFNAIKTISIYMYIKRKPPVSHNKALTFFTNWNKMDDLMMKISFMAI